MLKETLKVNECIKIGDNIEVVVVGIRGDRVLLGFKAPREVEILRAEIHRENKKEKRENDD